MVTVAELLRRTAAAYRSGELTWRQDLLIDEAGCRCTLGAIAYAANPADLDGDPMWIRPVNLRSLTGQAVEALAEYLVLELGAARCFDDDDRPDPVETVAGWNDRSWRTLAEVIAALDGAADRAEGVPA